MNRRAAGALAPGGLHLLVGLYVVLAAPLIDAAPEGALRTIGLLAAVLALLPPRQREG